MPYVHDSEKWWLLLCIYVSEERKWQGDDHSEWYQKCTTKKNHKKWTQQGRYKDLRTLYLLIWLNEDIFVTTTKNIVCWS